MRVLPPSATALLLSATAVLALGGARAPARAADAPTGDTTDCLRCHRTLDPGLVRAWESSVHFAKDVGCAACHGTNHDHIFDADGDVPAQACAGCHAVEVADFRKSKHARAWADMERSAMFVAQAEPVRAQTCMTCHAVGKRFPDGSVGKCNYCHTGHAFSAAEARSPDACHTCHMGPNHPQQEAYESSKHGILYARTHDPAIAPTCATCHLPDGLHDTSATVSLGDTIHGGVLEGEPKVADDVEVFTRAEFEKRRGRMLAVCVRCHSSRFARRSLTEADGVKREADRIVLEARAVIEDLHAEGLLEFEPDARRPNPVHGRTLVLGTDQLYEDTSAIEQRYFEMLHFHHANTFKGAYHNAPDVAHWTGIVPLKGALTDIRSLAQRLREQARLRAATGATPIPKTERYTDAHE